MFLIRWNKKTRILGWMKSMCEWSGGKITTFSRDHLSKLSSYTVSLDSSEYRKEVALRSSSKASLVSIQQHIFVCWPTATFENGVLIIGCGGFLWPHLLANNVSLMSKKKKRPAIRNQKKNNQWNSSIKKNIARSPPRLHYSTWNKSYKYVKNGTLHIFWYWGMLAYLILHLI